MMTIEMIIDSYDNVCDKNADDHGGLPGWMIKTIFIAVKISITKKKSEK